MFNIPTMAKSGTLVLLVVMYSFLLVFYRIIGVSDAVWGRYVVYFYVNIQVLLLLISTKYMSQRNNVLWWISVSVLIVNEAYNIFILSIHPEIREASQYLGEEAFNALNVGSSEFFTFSLLLFDVLFFVFLNSTDRKVKRIMLLFSIITSVYIVGFCFKASVVVYWIISVVLMVYFKTNKKINAISVISFLIFISIIASLITVFSDQIVRFIVSYSPSERLTKRLVLLINPDDVYASDSSYSARQDLWMESLNTWLSTPSAFFFGIGDHWGKYNSGIGQHSDFLDHLAKYGIFGTLFLLFMLKKAFNVILSLFDRKYRLQLLVIIAIYVACGFTKRALLPSVGFVMFMLLPLTAKYINNKDEDFKFV